MMKNNNYKTIILICLVMFSCNTSKPDVMVIDINSFNLNQNALEDQAEVLVTAYGGSNSNITDSNCYEIYEVVDLKTNDTLNILTGSSGAMVNENTRKRKYYSSESPLGIAMFSESSINTQSVVIDSKIYPTINKSRATVIGFVLFQQGDRGYQ